MCTTRILDIKIYIFCHLMFSFIFNHKLCIFYINKVFYEQLMTYIELNLKLYSEVTGRLKINIKLHIE